MNGEFAKAIAQDMTQENAYRKIVGEHSYRLLDCFTYEKKPAPFRSNRVLHAPPESEGSARTNLLDWETFSYSSVRIHSKAALRKYN